jgi:radical SAM protein with 4Fe4S-binding SPASM domain
VSRSPLSSIRHVLCVATEQCNLRCATCYTAAAARSLSASDARAALELLLRVSAEPAVCWSLSGGEPLLLGRDWLDEVLTLGDALARSLGKTVRWELQSNLLLLDDALLEVLAHHEVSIGASIDGPPALQELHRPGSTATLEVYAQLAARGRPPGLLCVVSAATHRWRRELVAMLVALGAPAVKLAPLRPLGRGAALTPPTAQQLLEVRVELMRGLLAGEHRIFDPDLYLYLGHLLLGRPAGERSCTSARCGAGVTSISVDVDGSLHPCIQPARVRGFRLGDVRRGLDAGWSAVLGAFHGSDAWTIRCFDCPARRICFFGCPVVAHATVASLELECAFTRLLWRHLSSRPAEAQRLYEILGELQQQLAPSRMGQIYRAR